MPFELTATHSNLVVRTADPSSANFVAWNRITRESHFSDGTCRSRPNRSSSVSQPSDRGSNPRGASRCALATPHCATDRAYADPPGRRSPPRQRPLGLTLPDLTPERRSGNLLPHSP